MPLLLPLLVAAPAWLVMAREIRRERLGAALGWMLLWALLLGIWSTAFTIWRPELAAAWIVNGDAYWTEMSAWLRTGSGREATPAEFIPNHLLHLAVFVVLSRYTASALSLPMGAALMHYMGYYVGRVAAASDPVWLGALLAWHPWAIIRIVAFVAIGVVLAQPLLLGRERGGVAMRRSGPLLAAAALGLSLDIVLKALAASHWRGLILEIAPGLGK
ncbi:MAG: hypothetical protein AB1635_02795 [Acidobacteriota bacterium]